MHSASSVVSQDSHSDDSQHGTEYIFRLRYAQRGGISRAVSSGQIDISGAPGLSGIKLIAALLVVMAASRSMAQEQPHRTAEKLGAVHFSTSCNAAAQNDVNRAVALLHSFQFSRAIDDFKVALATDATCAIAYWGIALSDWGNPFAPGLIDGRLLQLGRESAERGGMLGAKTERERAYLAAVSNLYRDFESRPQQARLLAYRDAMGDVAAQYPEDQEAKIFYALALAVAADPGDKTYADQLKAGAMLEKLFEQDPTHPGLGSLYYPRV